MEARLESGQFSVLGVGAGLLLESFLQVSEAHRAFRPSSEITDSPHFVVSEMPEYPLQA